jgi:hypothetical protein
MEDNDKPSEIEKQIAYLKAAVFFLFGMVLLLILYISSH